MLLPVSMNYVISCEGQNFSNPSTPVEQQPHPINVKVTIFFAFSSVFERVIFSEIVSVLKEEQKHI